MENTTVRTYSQLLRADTFEERYEYLRLGAEVGAATFGFDRPLNQQFYSSHQWQSVRSYVIARDNGCDLGVRGYEIHDGPLIHHMNPITASDILHGEEWILDPEYLILTNQRTHNAIHFGVDRLVPEVVIERSERDTKLW